MTESQQLLVEYVVNGSEAAFRELVSRYINLVYATAAREMDALRQPVAALQAELLKLKSETIHGPFRPRTDWADKGNGDPFSAIETMLWASSHRLTDRLRDVATPEAIAKTDFPLFPSEHPPIQTVGAVNLIGLSQNQERTRAVVTAFVREDFIAPPGGSPYTVSKLQGWQLVKADGGWKAARMLFFEIGRD